MRLSSRSRSAPLFVQGVLLFAFIPLVLGLYLYHPMGVIPSFAIAIPVMFGHRFLARPWMRAHLPERCLWCAGAPGEAPVSVPIGADRFVACSQSHARFCRRFAGFVTRWRLPIAAGIFVPLIVYVAAMIAGALGYPLIPPGAARLLFRVGVATTVILVSLLHPLQAEPEHAPAFPFPVHNLFLLGIRNTLWVFRVVGVWWLLISAGVLSS